MSSEQMTDRAPTRRDLLFQAKVDAQEAVRALLVDDYLRADILLKLAIDHIKDAGVLP